MALSYPARKAIDVLARALCVLATLLALVPLVSVLVYVAKAGLGSIDWSFFSELPTPAGEPGGGMRNAIAGTLVLVGLACTIGIPLGVAAGVYLAEFGESRFAKVVRFSADVMSGVPSIAVGVFAYGVVVLSMRRFSALAGGFALGILMLPTVTRTTEELLRLVPQTLREGALALGVPKWRATLRIVLVTALPGIATGVMLAVARVAGETAPLLFTAFNNRFWSTALDRPIGSLPVQIYTYAVSPYDDWHRQASAAALVLVAMVLILNIAARLFIRVRGGAK
ncbi:MAG TPA: phosphate ABC transporter permease PstA [Haliangiales bacterium]|nr:phosphate ABC transporter permease PstA [Haliangiales bacterium]